MSSLGDARDWDVFAGATLAVVEAGCTQVDDFDMLRNLVGDAQRQARDKAREAIASHRNARFQMGLGLWIERRGWRDHVPDLDLLDAPARRFAREVLTRLHRKALKRGRNLAELSAEKRHELRIAIKKLRYAADFFLPLFKENGELRRFGKSLSRLQDELGVLNDVSVSAGRVHALTSRKMNAAGHRAVGAVLGWQSSRLHDQDAKIAKAWRAFREHELPI